ncbi:enoyl-CoA hydratase/isomerase family protein [Micromonospora eburnea]|uniref:3,5-dihydroxyphenylacetyl-CoA monooxygenase n=1 Tax=Micromonospora eburnea TaxID=227316 RepID=A0A1C6UZ81_9ACTN|nr:enoyl-CoA hydratase/isomerase family protein [Micromonospora eburnea]SCL59267.1 3,5-dihydroxyphenylacetyl-CoA monooxygenase [Micromonospora eburnea]
MTSAPAFAYWLAGSPTFDGGLDVDRPRLEAHLQEGAGLLAALPPTHARNAQHQLTARCIDEECLAARSLFLARHAGEVHRRIARLHPAPRMSDLLRLGGTLFPELVPAEAPAYTDQASFIAALLADADAGPLIVDAMRAPTQRARRLLDEFQRTASVDLGRARIRRRGSAAHVFLTNPGAGNAEDDVSVADLEVAVDLALLDDEVRVAVLRGGTVRRPGDGTCRVFSAGVDPAGLRRGAVTLGGFVLRREFGVLAKVAYGLATPQRSAPLRKPWVAAVDTVAIGCGAEALAAFDRVLVAADAHAALPVSDEDAALVRLDAEAMVGRGLADEVVAPDDMDLAVGRATVAVAGRTTRGGDGPDLGRLAGLVRARARRLECHQRAHRAEPTMVVR